MVSIFVYQRLYSYTVSVNNKETKYTQIITLVPTMSPQFLLQLEIIVPYLIVLVEGTAFSILDIHFYRLSYF